MMHRSFLPRRIPYLEPPRSAGAPCSCDHICSRWHRNVLHTRLTRPRPESHGPVSGAHGTACRNLAGPWRSWAPLARARLPLAVCERCPRAIPWPPDMALVSRGRIVHGPAPISHPGDLRLPAVFRRSLPFKRRELWNWKPTRRSRDPRRDRNPISSHRAYPVPRCAQNAEISRYRLRGIPFGSP
jgi:hypothetical protein